MFVALQRIYRHSVQQAIVRGVLHSARRGPAPKLEWQFGGIFALFSAAAICGTLAQFHLG